MRTYKGNPIELLAPAGTFEIFKSVVHANCDAVYFGGSILNMRMIRKGYNFSNNEIEEAVKIAHTLGKKVYITVNNLFSHTDIEAAIPYLEFLESIKVDALIIQDFALFQLVKKLNLTMDLHSSVMMNVHNLDMINALESLGVNRVVTSREMSLETITELKKNTTMEFEYFAHGDMCVAHGAQCVYSGMLFGMSSNRGRCLKPCRWSYDIKKDGQLYKTGFPLAVKDMCLYEELPALINSGVTSFKLEGRMRDKDFITNLVNLYGDAIDAYLADPDSFDPSQGMKSLHDNRKRDLSTGYAFGRPGLDNINDRYEGTGKFYSTGKVFSTPTEEQEIDDERIQHIQTYLDDQTKASNKEKTSAKLTVKVANMAQALIALEKKVDILYLAADQFITDSTFSEADYQYLIENKGSTQIYLAFPKMVTGEQFDVFDELLIHQKIAFDGLLCTNIGLIQRYKELGYQLSGDTSLNCYNHEAIATYANFGVENMAVSIECPLKDIAALGLNSPNPLEITVHGRPTVMYLEHDLYENTQVFKPVGKSHNDFVSDDILTLKTPAGEYPVYKDIFGRNHMMAAKEICYFQLLKSLNTIGYTYFRIEGSTYTPAILGNILDAYKTNLNNHHTTLKLEPSSAGYTLAALAFD